MDEIIANLEMRLLILDHDYIAISLWNRSFLQWYRNKSKSGQEPKSPKSSVGGVSSQEWSNDVSCIEMV